MLVSFLSFLIIYINIAELKHGIWRKKKTHNSYTFGFGLHWSIKSHLELSISYKIKLFVAVVLLAGGVFPFCSKQTAKEWIYEYLTWYVSLNSSADLLSLNFSHFHNEYTQMNIYHDMYNLVASACIQLVMTLWNDFTRLKPGWKIWKGKTCKGSCIQTSHSMP